MSCAGSRRSRIGPATVGASNADVLRPWPPPARRYAAPPVGATCARCRAVLNRASRTYETGDEAIRHQISGAKINRFQVPSVPGANGWTGPDLHGNAIGHVYWTQGRCMMLIGLEVGGPRVQRLSAGAEAIYGRTGGTCPD